MERLLSAWYRGRAAIIAIVGDRVYTEIPANPEFPLLRLTLTGSSPTNGTWPASLHCDEAVIQIDAYGGPKVQARALMDAARSEALAAQGAHNLGVVTGVGFGEMSYLPDDVLKPPQPRYVCDISFYTHP